MYRQVLQLADTCFDFMEDFKEIIYFSAGLIVTAFIINFVAFLGTTTYQMADIRNSELQASENVRTVKKYNTYDNNVVTGIEVISLLRENALNGNLQIYIDKNRNNVSLIMNEDNYTASTWNLTNLLQIIDVNVNYTAILVYGYDNPMTAVYTVSSVNIITGVKFIRI